MIHKVDPDLWLDANFSSISPEQKLIVLALCLCDETTSDGVFIASQAAMLDMARILGMSPDSWASVVNGLSALQKPLLRISQPIESPRIQLDLDLIGQYFPRFKKGVR